LKDGKPSGEGEYYNNNRSDVWAKKTWENGKPKDE
jgi:hypothetical protein